MTAHHDRVRAVLVVHGFEADCRASAGQPAAAVLDLTARVARIQRRLDESRERAANSRFGQWRRVADTGAGADEWMLAVYDAALVELCVAVGVDHWLVDEAVCSDGERQRVELELLSSVMPLR